MDYNRKKKKHREELKLFEKRKKEDDMRDIIDLKMKIEEARAEVRDSYGKDPYDVTYEKNLKLDKLIEEYIELVENPTTSPHQFPPQPTTIE